MYTSNDKAGKGSGTVGTAAFILSGG